MTQRVERALIKAIKEREFYRPNAENKLLETMLHNEFHVRMTEREFMYNATKLLVEYSENARREDGRVARDKQSQLKYFFQSYYEKEGEIW